MGIYRLVFVPGSIRSFYWWVDVVGTVSLIPDIMAHAHHIVGLQPCRTSSPTLNCMKNSMYF